MHDDLRRYLEAPRWFQNRAASPLRGVAYFSPEFGIAEALPQYSGGLGVLAGDHLKAASSLGIPLTGVGLMYRLGYFRQHLDADGWQEERYPVLDPHGMALELVEGARVSVDLAGALLEAQVWVARIGRVELYLLDADVDANDDELRAVTDRLYGGGTEHRIRQEILLGIGGVRALEAAGVEPQVFHTNEGHAGFLGLERIRKLITSDGLRWDEAVEAARAGTVFTTHTPVPAGIDRFPRELMERYFCRLGRRVRDLDRHPHVARTLPGRGSGRAVQHGGDGPAPGRPGPTACPACTATPAGRCSRPCGRRCRPRRRRSARSPTACTAGRGCRPRWTTSSRSTSPRRGTRPDRTSGPASRTPATTRCGGPGSRAGTPWSSFVRERLRKSLQDRGVSVSDAAWTDEILDPRFLIVGFSRRFATYKRATLLLSQPDRLRALLLDEQRPLQLVFAGKAHPADDLGKEMIAQIVRFSRDPAVRHRITFIEDYDISVARMMYQGSDVWLNTPRRPMEASGTSGEKAALNGALNCSILDGWWDEMFDGSNGWAISSAEAIADVDHRDNVEANSLFELLERQIIPLFYDRGGGRFPRLWVTRVKASLRSLGPQGDGVADGPGLPERDVRAHRGPERRPDGGRPRPGPGPGRVEETGDWRPGPTSRSRWIPTRTWGWWTSVPSGR